MSASEVLRRIAGGLAVEDGILGACRLESGGVDVFGAENIGDAFRRAPVTGIEAALAVAAPGHLALFARTEVLFADLFGENIGRLWRVGQDAPGIPEPAVAVAFDTDLAQARADVLFEPGDHPALDAGAVDRVHAAGQRLLADPQLQRETFRARAFVVRAFGTSQRGAALFALHSLATNPVRTPTLSHAVVRWDGESCHMMRDPLRARAERVKIAG